MNDAEIFDREVGMRGLGRRFDPSWLAGCGPGNVYRSIGGSADSLISSARRFVPTLLHIHFDFVLNGAPNAFAFKSQGRCFIGLTTGVRYLLELVFSRMLSDSRLLEFIGDASGEADSLPPLTGYTADAEAMYQAGVSPVQPRTDGRSAYVGHLRREAISFLVGHEIAHISLGHVDYHDSRCGSAFIAEIGFSSKGGDLLLERQTLEWQADMRSVWSGIASVRETHATLDLPLFPWAKAREAPGLMMFHWAFAMNSLFRLLGDGRFSPSELEEKDYPPFPVRRAMAAAAAYTYVMETWDRALKDVTLAALRYAQGYTELAFATIFGENVALGGMPDAYMGPGREHPKRLMDLWVNDVGPRVAPFAYERTPGGGVASRGG